LPYADDDVTRALEKNAEVGQRRNLRLILARIGLMDRKPGLSEEIHRILL
jgi:hypothetical protein